MNPIVFHLVSGDAYFSGLLIVLFGVWSIRSKRTVFRKIRIPFLVIGFLFIGLSAVPVTTLEFIALISFLLLCLTGIIQTFRKNRMSSEQPTARKLYIEILVTIFVVVLIFFEATWRIPPKLEVKLSRTLIIFADSVTAGIGEGEAITWPQLLEAKQDLEIYDYSRMGATVNSQLKWIHTRKIPDGLIIVELGGNDIFGSTHIKDFEADLNELLKHLTTHEQTVLMFELPIPPTFNRFGIVQRKLATKFGVKLISKRVFTKVLAGKNTTLDTIHLSQAGHELMAEEVWSIISPAFSEHNVE